MHWFINSPVPYHPDKKYITPKHLFTNTWREGYYEKLTNLNIYNISKTFQWGNK